MAIWDRREGWDVEVIDENNYQRSGPRDDSGRPDHEVLQKLRPADVVGFYGGLSSTIPRLYELARFYRERGIPTIAGGQHFIEENIAEALHNGVDVVVIGEAEETIQELLRALEGKRAWGDIAGIAYLENGQRVPLDVKAGDRILFGKYAGSEIKIEGQEYLILREDEVLGVLEAKAQPAGKKK
jgi:radical SAM superfamily enzyme YgiQ (UPF0313 family)